MQTAWATGQAVAARTRHRYTGHRSAEMEQDRFSGPAGEPDDGRTPSEYGVPKLRRQILQRLADAYADDNLELSEYERRVRAAEYAATIEQLETLVADFPARPAPPPASPARLVQTPGATVTIMGERKLDDLRPLKCWAPASVPQG